MTSEFFARHRGRLRIMADGSLVTAGAFALMMGAAFGLHALGVAPLGEPPTAPIGYALEVTSWLLQVGGFIVGPAVVWVLYARRLEKWSIISLIIGYLFGGVFVIPVVMAGALLDWLVTLVSSVEFIGAITHLVVLVLAFVAVIVWLDVDAIKDLNPHERTHATLSVVRLVSTAASVVFAGVVIALMFAGEDAVEALAFLLMAAVQGAGVIAVADVVHGLITRNSAAGQPSV